MGTGQRPTAPRTNKTILHPSITVATNLTDDVDWRRQTAREERAVQFLKLGFVHADIVAALLERTDPDSIQTTTDDALDDEAN